MAVDLLERFEQPRAAFAIEASDRSTQAVDRLGQLLRLLRAPDPRFLDLGKLLLGDQVDRPDPLALGGQLLEQGGLGIWIGDDLRIEADLLRKPLRNALEPLQSNASIFGPPRLLGFGAGTGCSALLPRAGERLVRRR
jgi:hypothetical protein